MIGVEAITGGPVKRLTGVTKLRGGVITLKGGVGVRLSINTGEGVVLVGVCLSMVTGEGVVLASSVHLPGAVIK